MTHTIADNVQASLPRRLVNSRYFGFFNIFPLISSDTKNLPG
jgi:hypothetical protein